MVKKDLVTSKMGRSLLKMVRFAAVWLVEYRRADAVYFHVDRKAYFNRSKTFQENQNPALEASVLWNSSTSCSIVHNPLSYHILKRWQPWLRAERQRLLVNSERKQKTEKEDLRIGRTE